MPDKFRPKGCGSTCLRCWQNRLKHGNKESKAYLAKHPEWVETQLHSYEIKYPPPSMPTNEQHLWIDAQCNLSVKILKRQIQDQIQVSAEDQMLTLNGIELDNNGRKLSYYGLTEDSIIILHIYNSRNPRTISVHLHEQEQNQTSELN